MEIERLEKSVVWWNRAALIVPLLSTALMFTAYKLSLVDLYVLFYCALSAYILTAIIWWWWTMKNIVYLAKVLARTTVNIRDVVTEVKSMKQEINEVQNLHNSHTH